MSPSGAELATDRHLGPQLQVRSPDGLLIKINQLEPDPYRRPGSA